MSKQWLERLNIALGSMALGSDAQRAKLLVFVETLSHECEYRLLYYACQFCWDIDKWYTSWPHLIKVWQKNTCQGDFQIKILSRATYELH